MCLVLLVESSSPLAEPPPDDAPPPAADAAPGNLGGNCGGGGGAAEEEEGDVNDELDDEDEILIPASCFDFECAAAELLKARAAEVSLSNGGSFVDNNSMTTTSPALALLVVAKTVTDNTTLSNPSQSLNLTCPRRS